MQLTNGDTSEYKMRKLQLKDMKDGWFIGNFKPSILKTENFEVAYVKHIKDQFWEKHFHKHATEITLIIRGKIKINDEIFNEGDIFLIEPMEVADPIFLEDSEVIVIKTPSDLNDKYTIKR